ncbi:MAG: twin-arginine translocase subunit TatC [Pseudomonadota bacterium]|nr:twin-arginine translocase subunit TatC [Pseudomonadota bacterium]
MSDPLQGGPEEEGFLTHLIELRSRLIRALAAVGVILLGMLPFSNKLYTLLALPLLRSLPAGAHMIATEVTTPFFVPMKVAMMASLMVALPYVLWQVWAFVAPGLYAHEKRMVLPLVVSSTVLFYCGMAFAYFLVFPVVFGFITQVAPEGVAVMTDIDKYLGFVLTMFLAFGVTFEVPVAVVVLVRLGVVTVETLRSIRRYVIVGAFVVGAIFTPPDVVSQSMLALPLWLLYEVGIIAAARWKPAPAAEVGEVARR